MARAGPSHGRGARAGGLSNPFKPVHRRRTSDHAPFPSAKPSLHEAASLRSQRREDTAGDAGGSPPPDSSGSGAEGSPRGGLAATLHGPGWSKGAPVADHPAPDEDQAGSGSLQPGAGFFPSSKPQHVLSQTNRHFARKYSKQPYLSPANMTRTPGPSTGGAQEPGLFAPGGRTQGDLHGAQAFLRAAPNQKALQVKDSRPHRCASKEVPKAAKGGDREPFGRWNPQVQIGVGSETHFAAGALNTPGLPTRQLSTTLADLGGASEPTSPAAIRILRNISSAQHAGFMDPRDY